MPVSRYWDLPLKGGCKNDAQSPFPRIRQEKGLQCMRPGSNDSSPNGSAGPSPKNPTIWQKASNLRQSFRQSTRSKLGQKAGFDFPVLSKAEKSATLGTPSSVGKGQEPQIKREWKSQRSLSRERRSFVSKHGTTEELAATKRSLHSRSLCMAGEWDVDIGIPPPNEQPPPPPPLPPPPPPSSSADPKEPRSPRKLTKDSGYSTQCEHDYANSLTDWFSQEIALDKIDDGKSWSKDNNVRNPQNGANGEKRLEWNTRNRPLSFSHQEVVSERAKNCRQLRHSYSQREVSRHSHLDSVDSLANSSIDIKKQLATSVESVDNWPNHPTITKSTPHLAQGRSQRLSTSSSGSLLLSEPDESGGGNMVTRRFKKGSVYDALASTSGLDFSPVVQLKTYNRRDDSPVQGSKPSDNIWKKSANFSRSDSATDKDGVFYKDKPNSETSDATSGSQTVNQQDYRNSFASDSNTSVKDSSKNIGAHEKYPSWPVTPSQSTAGTQRSHSWTAQTDYPKEKASYMRPKKANQFKISTNQLQPVLERASEFNSSKSSSENHGTSDRESNAEGFNSQYQSCSASECSTKQFDFDGFQNPCIPQCYEEKEFKVHAHPERDNSSASSSATGTHEESQSNESNGFLSRYEDVLRHQAQYSVPLSSNWSKQRNLDPKGMSAGPETPFLDRLRLESNWQVPPPPVPMIPAAVGQQPPPPQPQQLQPQGNDFELSSENGTWMGSMESSSHGRGIPKWQGSYSDLSTLSTQLSNRSSLFDSGHSTMPESGRLSPQSSCDSTAPSLLLEGPTRAHVVARHGCHREIIAHSARVQQPERHGSESVLYYATSTSRINGESKISSKNLELSVANGNQLRHDEAMYRSHASVTLSSSHAQSNEVPDRQNKKCPSRQGSRKSSNSFSSEDSFPRSRSYCGDDTSGSSSDISNITCISNYRSTAKSKSLDESSPTSDSANIASKEQAFPNHKIGYDQPKSKSMEESNRNFVFPEPDKKHRVSDPDLKAIQKQAVMSFYQRISKAESMKASEKKSGQQSSDADPPPPYEATVSRKHMYPQKLSLMSKKMNKNWDNRNPNQISPQTQMPRSKSSDAALLNHHSKSVPNLVALKGQTLDVPPSHPNYRRARSVSQWTNNSCTNLQMQIKRGSPLSKDEIISWDQLPNVLEKKREATEKAAFSAESKDPPEDNGGCSSGMHYFKSHKSPRKVQLKEVHHSNETATVKVMTPDGVTLVQTHEQRRDDKIGAAPLPPHKRRPAPPPPPKQPPKRPPPPPPPVTPPPQVVVVVNEKDSENLENKAGGDHKLDAKAPPAGQIPISASSPQLGASCEVALPQASPSSSCYNGECPSGSDFPLPPPPLNQGVDMTENDEPLPPPPENAGVNVQPRVLDSSSLIYPKNSYMSYRSERKLGRQGFDGKYRRSFHTSASSVDLTTLGSSFQDAKDGFSPNSWERMHNIRQHGTTVIFHSDCIQSDNRLQRSSSQDCILVEEIQSIKTDNISNRKPSESEGNQSSSSINAQCSNNQGVPLQSVPYSPASQENTAHEFQNSPSDSHQTGSTKVSSSENPDNVVLNNDSLNENIASLDNRIVTDDSFVDSEKGACGCSNVDHNQNAVVRNNENAENNPINVNNGDVNHQNNAAANVNTGARRRRTSRTKEEIECDRLSMEFIKNYGENPFSLRNLLVCLPNHQNIAQYVEGLLNLELDTGENQRSLEAGAACAATNTINNENNQRDGQWLNNSKCNSLFNSKMRLSQTLKINQNIEKNSETMAEMMKRKDELATCIQKKVSTLKNEQSGIKEELHRNEMLGKGIANRLKQLAKKSEMERYYLHVEEMEKVVSLLVSVSARLDRAESILRNLPSDDPSGDKRTLEGKTERLRIQYEDAKRLKENIDRKSNQVTTFLQQYLTPEEYADYDRFMRLKTQLLMDIRELDERIHLGEEQLAALSVVAHLWRSAKPAKKS